MPNLAESAEVNPPGVATEYSGRSDTGLAALGLQKVGAGETRPNHHTLRPGSNFLPTKSLLFLTQTRGIASDAVSHQRGSVPPSYPRSAGTGKNHNSQARTQMRRQPTRLDRVQSSHMALQAMFRPMVAQMRPPWAETMPGRDRKSGYVTLSPFRRVARSSVRNERQRTT